MKGRNVLGSLSFGFFFIFEGEGWFEDMFFFNPHSLVLFCLKGRNVLCVIWSKSRCLRNFYSILYTGRNVCQRPVVKYLWGSSVLRSEPRAPAAISPVPLALLPSCLLHNFSDFAFSFSHTAGRRQPPSILLLPFPAWPLPPPLAWGLLEGCWGAELPPQCLG